VVLAGAAGIISVTVEHRRPRRLFVGLAWPTTVLLVGILLLLSTTGQIGIGPGALAERWWPAAVVLLGVWLLVAAMLPEAGSADQISLPLAGVTEASVSIRFGGGELTVERGSAGMLLSGEFPGGVVRRTGSPGRVELEPQSMSRWPWGPDWPKWRVGVSGEVPLDLRIEGGASRTLLDLRDLHLAALNLRTGASETRVLLPRAAGSTVVSAEGGAAALIFEVPSGVAARIRSKMALGSTNVDAGLFPRSGDGWESPDFGSAANRVEIDVRGGVGSVTVRGA
jgi:hypothetical protein